MWRRKVWWSSQNGSAAVWKKMKSPTATTTPRLVDSHSISHFYFPNYCYNNYRATAVTAVVTPLPLLLLCNNKTISFSSSSSTTSPPPRDGDDESGTESITLAEAKKLMRLVNVEALKKKLGMEGKEVIGYPELLEACSSMGVARTIDEAIAFARVLDDAGVVLLFRDKVYLHPDKV